ncbi:hypothetical protein A6I89_07635 [Prescottella equi]|uniref:Uncharacterized protein n=1 Tax=Rhodococcus hoagii TaxID=43767 RepID=A0AAE5IUQ2_RHOHA|nr:hypothetical protein H849_05185 [Prescottella equi NBRC 101255 = C 7]ORL28219.1 hypothetical protein A6I89_07635 [Prescottella equi]ORM04459.1 hypothetical protein A5N73_07355 [Prescottella equi]ORM31167.1 hypothetical protein A5N68_02820 [Prescottella equi]
MGDYIGFDVGILVGIALEHDDYSVAGLLLNFVDAVGDPGALGVLHADDVPDLQFGSGNVVRQRERTRGDLR